MDLALTQDNRLLKVDSCWEKDKVVLTHFHGLENLSRLFDYQLTLIPNRGLISSDVIGQPITVTLEDAHSTRYFNGVIHHIVRISQKNAERAYRIHMVPKIASLLYKQDYRIFQNQSVIDIFKSLCKENTIHDYDLSCLHYKYLPLDYCVQYDENQLEFLNRIFSQAGIFYCFTHEKDRHVMRLLDHPFYSPYHQGKVPYTNRQAQPDEWVSYFSCTSSVVGAQTKSSDYNYRCSRSNITHQTSTPNDPKKRRHFVYPGNAKTPSDITKNVNAHHLARSIKKTFNAESNVKDFIAGMQFDLKDLDENQFTDDYFITSVTHQAQDLTHLADQIPPEKIAQSYMNRIDGVPIKQIYTPERLNRHRQIGGMDTAFVMGVRDSQLHSHRYVEVKCQFHWDRYNQNDDKSSKWICVAQSLAGSRFGSQFLPRKGEEVLLLYRNGDPNEPMIMKSAYNAEHRLPFNDKDMQYCSGISPTAKGKYIAAH